MSKKNICPLLRKPCIEHECKMWSHVSGANPQTGALMDQFECALLLIPILLIENGRTNVGVQAAVESTRNEIVKRQDTLNAAIESASQGRRLGRSDEKAIDVSGVDPPGGLCSPAPRAE